MRQSSMLGLPEQQRPETPGEEVAQQGGERWVMRWKNRRPT